MKGIVVQVVDGKTVGRGKQNSVNAGILKGQGARIALRNTRIAKRQAVLQEKCLNLVRDENVAVENRPELIDRSLAGATLGIPRGVQIGQKQEAVSFGGFTIAVRRCP